jgi:amidase
VVAALGLDVWGERLGRPLTEDDVEPDTWATAQAGRSVTGTQYARGIDAARRAAHAIESWWEDEGWELLLTPTLPTLPPPVGQPLQANPFMFTASFNLSGQPAVSLPLHWSAEGVPVGVQLVAAYGREDVLIRVASQLEVTMPWAEREPPTARTNGR